METDDVYLKKFILGTMTCAAWEAEKGHDWQVASWKTQKASDIIPYKSEGLRTTG